MNSTSVESSKEPLTSTDVSFNGYSNGEMEKLLMQACSEMKKNPRGGGGGEIL